MIDDALWVTTNLFEVTTPGKDFINPRCFGEDFAEWLQQRLAAHGIASSEPIQEDWGWVLLAQFADRTFTVSIGVMDESIGQTPANWRIGVTYEKAVNRVRTWFKPLPSDSHRALFQKVSTILRDEPEFKVSSQEP